MTQMLSVHSTMLEDSVVAARRTTVLLSDLPCIYCPNNSYLALLIWFAAAGFLLVFFIAAFNFTVTHGMISGLIFYANIVWAYRGISVSLTGLDRHCTGFFENICGMA